MGPMLAASWSSSQESAGFMEIWTQKTGSKSKLLTSWASLTGLAFVRFSLPGSWQPLLEWYLGSKPCTKQNCRFARNKRQRKKRKKRPKKKCKDKKIKRSIKFLKYWKASM